jgi:hypothetical protein
MCLCKITFADQITVQYRTVQTGPFWPYLCMYTPGLAAFQVQIRSLVCQVTLDRTDSRRRCCLYVKHHLLIRSLSDFASIGRVGPEGVAGASITRFVGCSELLERFLVSGSSTIRDEMKGFPIQRNAIDQSD